MGGPGWALTRTGTLLRVTERETGEIVVERHYDPSFDEGVYLNRLNLIPSFLNELMAGVKYLSDEGLAQAAETVYRDVREKGWVYVAECIRVACLRMPWGQRQEKIRAIAKEVGIQLRQAQNWLQALSKFPPERIAESPIAESTFFVVAARQADPEEALKIAEEEKAANPQFTVRAFEERLKTPEPLHRDFCVCPTCGQKHLRQIRN